MTDIGICLYVCVCVCVSAKGVLCLVIWQSKICLRRGDCERVLVCVCVCVCVWEPKCVYVTCLCVCADNIIFVHVCKSDFKGCQVCVGVCVCVRVLFECTNCVNIESPIGDGSDLLNCKRNILLVTIETPPRQSFHSILTI